MKRCIATVVYWILHPIGYIAAPFALLAMELWAWADSNRK